MFSIKNIRQNRLQSLVLKAIVFVFILFILDFIFGSILANLYSKQRPGNIYRTNYSIDSTKADILIFGPSRANHHYVPEIFEKRMNLSCYNTGKDGLTILYNYAVLKSVLKRYSPKIVILDFSLAEFSVKQQSYDRLGALLPYYKTHPEMRGLIELRSPFEKIKLLSKIYPYNSLIFTILMGAMESHNERKQVHEQNGYLPLTEICKQEFVPTDTAHLTSVFDPNKTDAFKAFVRDCKDSNVKLYVIVSPRFVKYLHKDPSVTLAGNIAKENKATFYNFINDSLFYRNILFAGDGTHLNDTGARLFTNQVIDSIIADQGIISSQALNN